MKGHSAGQVFAACMIGLCLGMAQPLGFMLSFVIVSGTVIAAVLYAWCGLAPMAVYLAASGASVGLLYGGPAAAACLALIGVPSVMTARMMALGTPFFARLKAGILTQLLLFVALVAVLYLVFRRDLADVVVEAFNGMISDMEPVVRSLMLQQFASLGVFFDEATTRAIMTGALTDAEQIALLTGLYEPLGDGLRLGLPAMLVSSGILTGVVTALWPSYICSRRGDPVEYQGLENWFIPRTVVFGALAALVTALCILLTRLNGAEAVFYVVWTAVGSMLQVAGAAALMRSMRSVGRGPVFRAVLLVSALLFVPFVLSAVGLFSILMGRRGLISGYIMKKHNDNKEDDD